MIIMDLLHVHDYCIHNHILFRFNLKLNIQNENQYHTKTRTHTHRYTHEERRVEELYMREINIRT